MLFNLSKVFITVAALVATASAVPSKRQDELAIFNILLQGDVPVDQSNLTVLAIEFNYVLGSALATETGEEIFGDSTGIMTVGDDNSFDVKKGLAVAGETAGETSAIVIGWVGQTKEGLTANWLILGVESSV